MNSYLGLCHLGQVQVQGNASVLQQEARALSQQWSDRDEAVSISPVLI